MRAPGLFTALTLLEHTRFRAAALFRSWKDGLLHSFSARVHPIAVGDADALQQSPRATCLVRFTGRNCCFRFSERAEELRLRLVAWLKTHPEFSNKPESEGLSAAMQALYPCQ